MGVMEIERANGCWSFRTSTTSLRDYLAAEEEVVGKCFYGDREAYGVQQVTRAHVIGRTCFFSEGEEVRFCLVGKHFQRLDHVEIL